MNETSFWQYRVSVDVMEMIMDLVIKWNIYLKVSFNSTRYKVQNTNSIFDMPFVPLCSVVHMCERKRSRPKGSMRWTNQIKNDNDMHYMHILYAQLPTPRLHRLCDRWTTRPVQFSFLAVVVLFLQAWRLRCNTWNRYECVKKMPSELDIRKDNRRTNALHIVIKRFLEKTMEWTSFRGSGFVTT